MAINGQIWATPGASNVALHCQIPGTGLTTYNLNSPTYLGNPGTTGLWKVNWPGYCAATDYWIYNGSTWSIAGGSIAVAGSVGSGGGSLCQMYGPANLGALLSGRVGTIGELAVLNFSGTYYLVVCIASGTTNNWQAIHV